MKFLDLLEATASKVDSGLLTEAKENIIFVNKTSILLFDLADDDRLEIKVNSMSPEYKTIKDVINDKENVFVAFNDMPNYLYSRILICKFNKQLKTLENIMSLEIKSFVKIVRQGETFEKADEDLKKYFKEGYKALKYMLEKPDEYFTEPITKKLKAEIHKRPDGSLEGIRFYTSFAMYVIQPGGSDRLGSIKVNGDIRGESKFYTFLNKDLGEVKEIIEASKKAKNVDLKGLLVAYEPEQILSQMRSKYAKDIDTNFVLGRIDNNGISNSLIEKLKSLGIEVSTGVPSLTKKGDNLIYTLAFKLK